MKKEKCIIFAAGGTAGHINPALSIAKAIRKIRPEYDIHFCGTDGGLEQSMVSREFFPFHVIHASPFRRKINKELFTAVHNLYRGEKECANLIKELGADLCVGTGGYVCAPLMSAARKNKVKRLIHEQNVFAGRSNRVMGRSADCVCVSFAESAKYFRHAQKVKLTGNPVSAELFSLNKEDSRHKLGLTVPEDKLLILATGGSLGARTINQTIIQYVKNNIDKKCPYKFILAAGRRLYDEAKSQYREEYKELLEIKPYLFDMPEYMSAADLIVTRAGAISCAEIAAIGRASIMIPYPFAAEDHQTYNAQVFVDDEAALMCRDDLFNFDFLSQSLASMSNEKLALMGENAKKLGKKEAIDDIVNEAISLLA